MTVKELKEKLEGLDPDMKVGGVGHFGEFLQTWGVRVTEAAVGGGLYQEGVKEEVLYISIESPGPDPD